MVSVPVKIWKVTFMAELYVLEAKHIPMIIDCDLLKNLHAKIDFEYKHAVINSQCAKPDTRALLGVVINSSSILRIHVTSPILGERMSAITLTQQRKQWLSVELNRWRSGRTHCYF